MALYFYLTKFKNCLFSRSLCHEIIKILISFIFVFVIGGKLAQLWQNQEYQFQNQLEQKKYEREIATNVFKVNGKLMDKLVLDFQLLGKGVVDKNTCKQDFIEWKENFSGNKALLEKYFGEPALNSFVSIETEINQLFNTLIIDPDTKFTADLQTAINELETTVYNFNKQIIEALLTDNIGSNLGKGN
ncbi:MAG: hypothetical protein NT004_05805 [Bacteroidetes bacterium]|nr:hypothetical protein [Bacteroidota bacterium]